MRVRNVYTIFIYYFKSRSTVKCNKWRKWTTFITNHPDMQHGLARILFHVYWWTVSIDTLVAYILTNSQTRITDYIAGTVHRYTDCYNFQVNVRQWRHLLSTVAVMFAVLLAGILQGVERPGSVYSIMPQWWHLMVLQYVAASFHLQSVSTANINTMRYTKTYQQHETPTIAAAVISKMLLPQSNIKTFFVQSHSCHFSDVCPGIPIYSNHNQTKFTTTTTTTMVAVVYQLVKTLAVHCHCDI